MIRTNEENDDRNSRIKSLWPKEEKEKERGILNMLEEETRRVDERKRKINFHRGGFRL